jgi:hypothetical protein
VQQLLDCVADQRLAADVVGVSDQPNSLDRVEEVIDELRTRAVAFDRVGELSPHPTPRALVAGIVVVVIVNNHRSPFVAAL